MINKSDFDDMMGLCWSFSPNSALFANWPRNPDPRAALPVALHTERSEVVDELGEIGERLQCLAAGEVPNVLSLPRTMLSCCELVLAAVACQEGNRHPNLARDLADSALEVLHGGLEDELSEDLTAAHRELFHLLSIVYRQANDLEQERACLQTRQSITCTEFDHRPDLVGASFVQYGDVIEEKTYEQHQGKLWHYWAPGEDLAYLVEHIDNDRYPQPERHTALTWLQAAWERLALPENQVDEQPPRPLAVADDIGRHARELKAALVERGVDKLLVLPRCGVFGRFYCDEVRFTARVIRDFASLDCPHRDLRCRMLNHRYALEMGELDDLGYAMERYEAKSLLAGMTITYDEDLSVPFAALDLLKQ